MQEIVGARFHCAICENVDICSNCDSAGLPLFVATDGSPSGVLAPATNSYRNTASLGCNLHGIKHLDICIQSPYERLGGTFASFGVLLGVGVNSHVLPNASGLSAHGFVISIVCL